LTFRGLMPRFGLAFRACTLVIGATGSASASGMTKGVDSDKSDVIRLDGKRNIEWYLFTIFTKSGRNRACQALKGAISD
jgi:hypothetical protein